MSLSFYAFFGLVAILLLLFVWAARKRARPEKTVPELRVLEESGRGHVAHLPQIRQALAETDSLYISGKASAFAVRRVALSDRSFAIARGSDAGSGTGWPERPGQWFERSNGSRYE